MSIPRALALTAGLTVATCVGLAVAPAAANAYLVPGPDRCEVFLAHELGIPGFDRDDPANAALLGRPEVAALLARPECTATRTVPPRAE
jgi:hypothetical protein